MRFVLVDSTSQPIYSSPILEVYKFLSSLPALRQLSLANRDSHFIYFWLCWIFVAAHRLSLVVATGGYSWLQCTGFSLKWLLLLQSMGSRCMGFSSCNTQTQ